MDSFKRASVAVGTVASLLLVYACGARTDLLIDREPLDASFRDARIPEVGPEVQPEAGLRSLCFSAVPLQETDPVYFQFVVDGSGSMLIDRKWDAATFSLDSAFDGFLSYASAQTSVGLIVFSDRNDVSDGLGPYPSGLDVRLAGYGAGHHRKLRDRVDYTFPYGGTPMRLALEGGLGEIEQFAENPLPPSPRGGRKVVVLLTDGVPGRAEEKDEILALAGEHLLRGTRVFVIGIGKLGSDIADYDPAFLSKVAIAGGTPRTSDCLILGGGYCHYQIEPDDDGTSADTVAALNDARSRSSRSCEYAIAGDGRLLAEATEVLFDDGAGKIARVARDAANGWTYNTPENPTRIVVAGETCRKLQENKQSGLSIRLSCEKE